VLTPDGVVLANINGALFGSRNRIMRSEYKTLATVFDHVYLFPHLHDTERAELKGWLDPDRIRSLILVAMNGPSRWTKDQIIASAAQLAQANVVRIPTFLEDAGKFYEGRVVTDDVPLLTDDYAPVDTMVY
jgi:hypothetical protein